jgi:hypothetical protein
MPREAIASVDERVGVAVLVFGAPDKRLCVAEYGDREIARATGSSAAPGSWFVAQWEVDMLHDLARGINHGASWAA